MINFVVIVICLIFSAFFSSSEIAFASANKVRLKRNAEEKGTVSSKLAYKIYENYDRNGNGGYNKGISAELDYSFV